MRYAPPGSKLTPGPVTRIKDYGQSNSAPRGTVSVPFLSPPVRMHGGLICVTFCLSVCPSVTGPKFTGPKVTRPKFVICFKINPFNTERVPPGEYVTHGGRYSHQNAGGLTSTSSCIFFGVKIISVSYANHIHFALCLFPPPH